MKKFNIYALLLLILSAITLIIFIVKFLNGEFNILFLCLTISYILAAIGIVNNKKIKSHNK